jgi:hypothetical protein
MLKFKVTDKMIDAGVSALKRCAVEDALRNREPVPDFDSMNKKDIEAGRWFIRSVIQAAAQVALTETKP